MPGKSGHQAPSVENYSRAIARAIEWLGDRYLLARPSERRLNVATEVPRITVDSVPSPRASTAFE